MAPTPELKLTLNQELNLRVLTSTLEKLLREERKEEAIDLVHHTVSNFLLREAFLLQELRKHWGL